MFPTNFPPEIWLLVLELLCTEDVLASSLTTRYMYSVAEYERKKRQHQMDKHLSKFVYDVDTFRLLMRETGSVLVGDVASTLFNALPNETKKVHKLTLFFHVTNLACNLRS